MPLNVLREVSEWNCSKTFKKTVYNPSKISTEEYIGRGMEAAANAARRSESGTVGREWTGVYSHGVSWHGYTNLDRNVTSFYPEDWEMRYMHEMILTDADLMNATHWPITVTFGLYGDRDSNCASVARDASEGIGYSFNDKGLSFWGKLDEYDQAHEEPFDAECFVVHDSCTLTYSEFYHYMELVCQRFAKHFPAKAQEIEEDLEKYATRFF